LVLMGTWWTCLYFLQRGLLFPVTIANAPPRQAAPPGVEVLQLPMVDSRGRRGAVEAWFAAAPNADAAQPAALAVYFHGNCERIDQMAHIVAGYRRLGVNVLIPEYRGYGRSVGEPSQATIGADMRQWMKQMSKRPEVDGRRVFYHGRSVGSGVACELARTDPPAGLILETPFVSIAGMSWRFLAPPLLVRDPYRNDAVVRKATWPMLIFGATQDGVVGVEGARRLRDVAPAGLTTYVEFATSHNDFPGVGQERPFWEAIGALVERGAAKREE
jgi:pimeloyl-ACP methyl ester carboxylesterase